MPELPDVEVQKRYFDRNSLNRRIIKVEVREPRILKGLHPKKLQEACRGLRFESSYRHGKYLFVGLDHGSWIVFHFGMDGYLAYAPERENPEKNARALFHFENDHRLSYQSWRMLGRIALTEDPFSYLAALGIGPDALDPALDLRHFREALAGRKSPLKPVLMDQHVLAGIGNIYADEILFHARIHPSTRADLLDQNRLRLLHGAVRKVLQSAIRYHAEIEKFPDSYLLPHRHSKGHCPRCGRVLETVRIAGRTGYFCPHDQSL